jgi:hypothetical protein
VIGKGTVYIDVSRVDIGDKLDLPFVIPREHQACPGRLRGTVYSDDGDALLIAHAVLP